MVSQILPIYLKSHNTILCFSIWHILEQKYQVDLAFFF